MFKFIIKGPWTSKLTYHFPKKAQFSENFDSDIGTQRSVNTNKLTFEIDDLRNRRRKRNRLMTSPRVPVVNTVFFANKNIRINW